MREKGSGDWSAHEHSYRGRDLESAAIHKVGHRAKRTTQKGSRNRMTDAKLTSIGISMDKAFTAAGHKIGTHLYKDAVWPGGAAFGINNSNGGRFSTIGGGLPVKNAQGQVVGAIGCSTGTPAQDQEVAQAGLDALNEYLMNTFYQSSKL